MFIGERLAMVREDADLSQKELAAKLGVKQKTISAYESDVSNPSVAVLYKIVQYFGVSADYFLGFIDVPAPINRENSIALPKGYPVSLIPKVRECIRILYVDYKHQKKQT